MIWKNRTFIKTFFLVSILALFILYVYNASFFINNANLNRFSSDQSHNIELSYKALSEIKFLEDKNYLYKLVNNLPHYTSGVVNPLWPWLTHFIQDQNPEIFFKKGKILNYSLSIAFILFFIFFLRIYKKFGYFSIFNWVALSLYCVFLPQANYFQPETIYYILFFFCWIICIKLLYSNDLWLYFCLGIFSALAYLAKSSISPLLLMFVAISFYKVLCSCFPTLLKTKPQCHNSKWQCNHFFLGIIFSSIIFSIITMPRFLDSYDKYGSPTHSYPKYWMWLDSFDESINWMHLHNSKEKLASIEENDFPSLKNYLDTHSLDDFIKRLSDGTYIVFKQFFMPVEFNSFLKHLNLFDNSSINYKSPLPYRGLYILTIFLGVIFSYIIFEIYNDKNVNFKFYTKDNLITFFFIIASFILYNASYGFYSIIGKGDRFMMSLYIPIIYSLYNSWNSMLSKAKTYRINNKLLTKIYYITNLIITIHIFYSVIYICLRSK